MLSDEADWRPDEMPTLMIVHLARLLTRASDDMLRQVGITASQLPVLVALKNGEKRTQMELARIAGVEQPSMAQLLARMERDGLVHREPSPDDRRSSLVSLTDLASDRLEPGRDALRSVDEAGSHGLSEDERKLLLALVKRMVENIEGMG